MCRRCDQGYYYRQHGGKGSGEREGDEGGQRQRKVDLLALALLVGLCAGRAKRCQYARFRAFGHENRRPGPGRNEARQRGRKDRLTFQALKAFWNASLWVSFGSAFLISASLTFMYCSRGERIRSDQFCGRESEGEEKAIVRTEL